MLISPRALHTDKSFLHTSVRGVTMDVQSLCHDWSRFYQAVRHASVEFVQKIPAQCALIALQLIQRN
jgi:hypothetical protein